MMASGWNFVGGPQQLQVATGTALLGSAVYSPLVHQQHRRADSSPSGLQRHESSYSSSAAWRQLTPKRRPTALRAFNFYFGEPPPPPWWLRPRTWYIAVAVIAVLAAALQLRMRQRRTKIRRRMSMQQSLEAAASQPSPRTLPRLKLEEESAAPPAAKPAVEAAKPPAAAAPAPAAPAAAEPPAAAAVEEAAPAVSPPAAAASPPAPTEVVESESESSTEAETAAASDAAATTTSVSGREVQICKDEEAAKAAVLAKTVSLARSAIEKKGAFSMAVSGGEVADALRPLASEVGVDFSKFHVFFCYDITRTAQFCEEAKATWLDACGVPAKQVHSMAASSNTDPAAQYTALICSQEETVIADGPAGLPSLDLVLLSTSDDGTCGALAPGASPMPKQVIMPVELEGEPAVSLTFDGINEAEHVIVLAAPGSRQEMVRKSLTESAEGDESPGAKIKGQNTLWVVTDASKP